ncbi:hypothetical protein RND81_08G126900 [Saponaria officinalis]|uniref:Bet v I/Major latex protein domain-containing protein n=1 Tax=Saponaria officinalis TaxID=3572 RepID=A0AAW1J794_SAPOF
MGVTGKLEIEVDIKSSGDVFHELFSVKPHHVTHITPDKVHGCELHEGDFGKPGSIILWEYTVDGKKCVAKEKVEEINEEKKFVKFKVIEGSDILEDYKSMSVTIQVIPKGEIDAILWAFEFEMFHDIGPYPTALMDVAIAITRDIETHHLK